MLYPWQVAVSELLDACDRPCVILLQGGLGKTFLKHSRSATIGEAWFEEEEVCEVAVVDVLLRAVSRLGAGRVVVNLLPGSELAPDDEDDVPKLEFQGVRVWVLERT
jgi:hypothetical protein